MTRATPPARGGPPHQFVGAKCIIDLIPGGSVTFRNGMVTASPGSWRVQDADVSEGEPAGVQYLEVAMPADEGYQQLCRCVAARRLSGSDGVPKRSPGSRVRVGGARTPRDTDAARHRRGVDKGAWGASITTLWPPPLGSAPIAMTTRHGSYRLLPLSFRIRDGGADDVIPNASFAPPPPLVPPTPFRAPPRLRAAACRRTTTATRSSTGAAG